LFHRLDPAELRGRHGMKWSKCPPGVLPSWVADMDYPVAPVIGRALRAAVERSDLGYPPDDRTNGLPEAFAARAARLWGWDVDPARVHSLPDVVRGVALCVERLTAEGDCVLVGVPAYPPLRTVVRQQRRRLVEVALGDGSDGVRALIEAVVRHRPRLVLFCNPHNPTGRVFTEAELRAAAHAAVDAGAALVSDEVHAELVYEGRHVPLASLGRDIAANTVTLTSASKAFNLAGLRCAVMTVGAAPTLAPLVEAVVGLREPVGALGILATLAAWTPEGDEWLDACRTVLDGNRRLIATRLAGAHTGIRYTPPPATYLAWLDCRALPLDGDPALWLLRQARVAVSSGTNFGQGGQGFVRLNFATSPAILDKMLGRIVDAAEQLGSEAAHHVLDAVDER
jgi:cystathionine beta-lyase